MNTAGQINLLATQCTKADNFTQICAHLCQNLPAKFVEKNIQQIVKDNSICGHKLGNITVENDNILLFGHN